MTAKEYLSQLYKVKQRQWRLKEQIDELTVRAGYGTGRSYARNFSGCNDRRCPMEIALTRKFELENRLEEELAQCDALERDIRGAIDAVLDEHLRTILLLRYVLLYSWPRIALDQGYDGEKGMRRLFRHHGDALNLVHVPEKNTTYSA